MESPYDHLHESTVPLLDLSAEERKRRCRTKRWIPYDGARKAYDHLEEMLACDREQRPECMLLLAPTGNGKSMILERFLKNHPATDNLDNDAAHVPVLHFEMPDDATVNDIMLHLLGQFHSPLNSKSSKPDRRRELFSLMEKSQVKVLLVDELHHLATARQEERLKILTFLKMVGNGPRVHVAAAGIQEGKRILQSDPQLLNRFDIYKLPIWKDEQKKNAARDDSIPFRQLLASFESLLPLKKPSGLGEIDAIARLILHMSDGMIGEVFKILYRSAQIAIDTGTEAITEEILRRISYQSPTQRKVEIVDIEA